MSITKLNDLNRYKTAPYLNQIEHENLAKELNLKISNADWLTIGVMANSDIEAKEAILSITSKYSFINFRGVEELKALGNVFLKGNQKTGEVYIRTENGLGEGILLTCQYDDESSDSSTFGPLPLNFFCY